MNRHAEDAERSTPLLRSGYVPAAPHILIAEDQPAIQNLLHQALQLAGYRTTVCGGRHTALALRDQALLLGNFHCVLLLDLSLLCVAEATDFLRRLRDEWRDVGGTPPQIIVLTTSTQVQAELALRECVLQKPFHIRELLTLIQQVVPIASLSEEYPLRETGSPLS